MEGDPSRKNDYVAIDIVVEPTAVSEGVSDPDLRYLDGGLATVRDIYDPGATEVELAEVRAGQDYPL